ncbi:hypothetical protein ACBJ59_61235 [Nonomuraea sp. MTCD27]|uniref:hypothetical protein n=1 Tax=Nonomuraea sp. MTCD27 TaxID=1676747 RepID=UPI0035C1EE98
MTHLTPTVGSIVHYTSHGTPGGEYTSQCRAAIVTAVDTYQDGDDHHLGHVSLAVLNPDGQYFARTVQYDDGAETPGSPDCPSTSTHGNPFRYCGCGWAEGSYRGGTWHWPEGSTIVTPIKTGASK